MSRLLKSEEWYLHADKNIRDLLRALHRLDVWTVFSCEGHIRNDPIYVGEYPWPWVIVQGTLKQIGVLEQMLTIWNTSHPLEKWILSKERMHRSFTPEFVGATFSGFVTTLVPICENHDLSADVLLRLQDSANKLAEFLNSQQ